ncbi:AAA family ATPase [Caloramator sp. E03]|uniref:DNA polymerase III subunit n=1 Tax=Caloramator sp. E03 TaxID=2576307 RepID=UPI001110AE6E|nr:DNA polymerase III subunit delta' C-terminal domain-containing protein [Caloramator sp. E03]QCX33473.1 AAA family ATPase [Caloramator sp. E03]
MFEVVGQEFVKNALMNMYNNRRLSHAFMIVGPEGIGKSIFAKYIASLLLCKGEQKPCGKCISCIKVQHGNHPDVKVISSSKSIGIDIIREIINDVNIKPYEGDKKVVIVKGADKITLEGQNALLKTLEEPIEDTTIILLAEKFDLILDTITSRCQVFHLGKVAPYKIEEYLINQGIEKEKAKTLSSLSDGIVGNALKYLDSKYVLLREEATKALKDIIRSDKITIMDRLDFFLSEKENINEIFDIMISVLRDIVILKLTKDKDCIINKDIYETLIEECKILSFDKASKIINILADTKKKLDDYLNYQLTIEDMLLNIQEV